MNDKEELRQAYIDIALAELRGEITRDERNARMRALQARPCDAGLGQLERVTIVKAAVLQAAEIMDAEHFGRPARRLLAELPWQMSVIDLEGKKQQRMIAETEAELASWANTVHLLTQVLLQAQLGYGGVITFTLQALLNLGEAEGQTRSEIKQEIAARLRMFEE